MSCMRHRNLPCKFKRHNGKRKHEVVTTWRRVYHVHNATLGATNVYDLSTSYPNIYVPWKHLSVEQIKCTFAKLMFISFYILPRIWCNFCFILSTCFHYRWKLKCSPQMQLKGGDLREIAIDRVQANLMFEVYATIKFHSNIHGRQKSLEKFIF